MGRRGGRQVALVCHDCDRAVDGPLAYRCPDCDGPVVVTYPAPADAGALRADPAASGVWRYRAALPATETTVTLAEGATPLLALPEAVAGRPGVLAKLELLNPTLSFKDRAMALGASVAVDAGAPGLALASTGNAAVSAAAYAAAAGLPCRIVCAASAAGSDKLTLARALGAHVAPVDGDYSTAHAEATAMEADGWCNVTTTYRNPLLAEAHRTVAYELAAACDDEPVDVVVVPVGAGPLLFGIHSGFADLAAAGLVRRPPRMVGVQGAGCDPLVHAFAGRSRQAWLDRLWGWGPAAPTLAAAIADPLRGYEREGLLTLEAIADSGGRLLSVDDAAIRAALSALAGGGIVVEAAAAAALAALPHLAGSGAISEGERIVVVLTGHGMKERATLDALAGDAEGQTQGG